MDDFWDELKWQNEKAKIVERNAERRYDPTLPHCAEGGITLLFDGKKLYLSGRVNGVYILLQYNAVSGIPDAKGNFDYSIQRQMKPDVGPIPEGKYWINPAEFWERGWYKPWMAESWGDYRITIHPFPETNTFGSVGSMSGLWMPRGGFFIHGGVKPGSKGCIDLTGEMDSFYKDVKSLVKDNPQCRIQLLVKYK